MRILRLAVAAASRGASASAVLAATVTVLVAGVPVAALLMDAPASAAPRSGAGRHAAADEARGVIAELTGCRSLTDNAARLACYDAAAAKLAAATASGDVKILDREEVRETRRGLFGFDLPKLPFFKGDDTAKDTPQELDTTVRGIAAAAYGKYTLTMEDGAVWQTAEPLPRDPKTGMKVHINRGAIGNYFLKVGSMRAVRAARVK